MPRRVRLGFDLGQGESTGAAVFVDEALRRDLTHILVETWPTSAKLEPRDALWRSTEPQATTAVVKLENGTLAFIRIGFGTAVVQVAAADEEGARAGLDEIQKLLPRAKRDDEGRVPITFWTYSPHGPMPMRRDLSVPTWNEIASNYREDTRASLTRLMGGELSWRGGQLILWHGETGTGKTTALRALAREWASWCEAHYIVDPEKFFGEQTDYMLSVMFEEAELGADEDEAMVLSMHGYPVAGFSVVSGEGAEKPSWRLLILEDTGELLSADARVTAGQGLSRFLNVVDGLIGQGLRVLVLVTTNEELGRLHPAVARPGRCAANVVFTRLPIEQANAWLRDRGQEAEADGPMTLAALYAQVEGWDAVSQRQAFGFG
jgi:hypothetical protein